MQWHASPRILWAALCHCEDCRRAASSDYVSWFGVARESVEWSGPRKVYRSSAKVERSFCSSCGAPLSFEAEKFADETHLYAATLDRPELYQPTAHLYWAERLPWVHVRDDLPTYDKGFEDTSNGQT
ncbi:MAG: GFA family protein [Pseudomonadota bacterium]